MAQKIIVSSGCIACGLCIGSPYIEETPEGTAVPKGSGILPDKEEMEFLKLLEGCPAKAISLETMKVKSKDGIIQYMNQTAAAFQLQEPSKEQLAFDEKNIVIPIPEYVKGEQTDMFSNYNRAKEAASDAVNRAMFSQRKTIIQNIINNYRIDKLMGYYEYKEAKDNFYYSANKTAQKLLDDWIREIQINHADIEIPEKVLLIQTRPVIKGDFGVEIIRDYLLSWADSILSEMSGNGYRLSDYALNCDIDDTEVYEGTGMFGREKYVTKYYFKHTRAAFEEIAQDIRRACVSSFEEHIIDSGVWGIVKNIVEAYSKKLQEELKYKANELQRFL